MYSCKKYDNNIYYFKLANLIESEFINYINDFDYIFNKKNKFKLIFDLSEISIKDALYIKPNIIYMNKNKNNTNKFLIKSTIIINNDTILKIINNLILSIYKPIKPNIIVNNLNEAFEYLNN